MGTFEALGLYFYCNVYIVPLAWLFIIKKKKRKFSQLFFLKFNSVYNSTVDHHYPVLSIFL